MGHQVVAELLTDVALDAFLTGKLLNAFVKLGKIGLAQRATTVPLVKEFRPRRSATFYPAQSDELVITAEKAAKILVDNKPYSPAAEVVELTSQALIENSCSAQLVIKPAKPTSSAVVPPAPKNPITPATKVPGAKGPSIRIPIFTDCMHEIEPLVAKISIVPPNTFPVIKYPTTQVPMNLTLDIKHFFFGELGTSFRSGKMIDKLYGFHRDYEGRLRKVGRLSYLGVTQGPLGTFSVQKVVVDGKAYTPRKTFFPETMDHQTVVDNIWDALGNGTLDLKPNGDLQINGLGRSGIEIECFVTPQGKVTTAYPVIKKP